MRVHRAPILGYQSELSIPTTKKDPVLLYRGLIYIAPEPQGYASGLAKESRKLPEWTRSKTEGERHYMTMDFAPIAIAHCIGIDPLMCAALRGDGAFRGDGLVRIERAS